MGDNLKNLLIFTSGLAIGGGATYVALKSWYKRIADDEIADMKRYYESKLEDEITEEEEVESEPEDKEIEEDEPKVAVANHNHSKPDLPSYSSVLDDNGYTYYSNSERKQPKEENTTPTDDPRVITSDEYGEIMDYDTVSLVYYQGDDYLADETGELVDDVEHKIGWELLDFIGKYEDDALHVRNDDLKTDFEILRDHRSWRDVVGR